MLTSGASPTSEALPRPGRILVNPMFHVRTGWGERVSHDPVTVRGVQHHLSCSVISPVAPLRFAWRTPAAHSRAEFDPTPTPRLNIGRADAKIGATTGRADPGEGDG